MQNVIIFLFLFIVKLSYCQNPEQIIGNWLTSDSERKITIYKQNEKFYGKIIWVKDQKKDNEIGKIVMSDLEYREGKYDNGTFIMPDDKHQASCALEYKEENLLKVTIYHGLKLFGHSIYLYKTKM